MIGDRFVKISFTAERNSKAPPMVSIEIVWADDPVIKMENFRTAIQTETSSSRGKIRTRCLALIEAEQEQYDTCNYEEKA
jgi:hypothetical protein